MEFLFLPLYWQEQELARCGVTISRPTMANWVILVHKHYFAAFIQALHEELLDSQILHADETTLLVLREDTKQCYVWVCRASGDTERPVILCLSLILKSALSHMAKRTKEPLFGYLCCIFP